jgi:hypothetical protein
MRHILTRDELLRILRKAAKYVELIIEIEELHSSTEIRLPNGELKDVCNECTDDLGFPCTTRRLIKRVM